MTFAGTLVVLTEDSGTSGWRPVVACVRAICDQLIAHVEWARVRLLPREDAPSDALRSIGANRWKGRGRNDPAIHNDRITLVRYIANQLLGAPDDLRFVFFHVDADRPWSAGPVEQCENAEKFDLLIRGAVRQVLRGALAKNRREDELDARMARLHLVVSAVAIESWLYQNTAAASTLCRGRCGGRHVAQYDAWRDDRAQLDELLDLKNQTRHGHCLDDRDKAALAEALPAAEMRAAGRSFAHAVECAGDDGELLTMLIATGAAS